MKAIFGCCLIICTLRFLIITTQTIVVTVVPLISISSLQCRLLTEAARLRAKHECYSNMYYFM